MSDQATKRKKVVTKNNAQELIKREAMQAGRAFIQGAFFALGGVLINSLTQPRQGASTSSSSDEGVIDLDSHRKSA